MKITATKLPKGRGIQDMCAVVQRETSRFGLFLDLDRLNEYKFHYDNLIDEYTRKIEKLAGVYDYRFTRPADTIYILKDVFGVPATFLTDPHKGTLSASEGIINKVAKQYAGTGGPIEEFIKYYRVGREASTLVSTFNSYIDLPKHPDLDRDGHRMVVAHPVWKVLSTSRLSASEPACQNINRDHFDIVTAPRGWQIVRADSGQIEPRIQWSYFTKDSLMRDLITAYDDAYYAYYDFISMSADREAALRADFAKNFKKLEITDDIKEGRQQMKRMSLAANYGSTLPADAGFDPVLAKLYTERIVNHPARIALSNKIRDEVYRGRTSFSGAFGTEVTPDSTTKYSKSDGKAWTEHLIRCGLNNPIQTTASELNCFAIFNCMDIIENKCKNSALAYSKHDEGAVYLNEDNGDIDYAQEIADSWSYDVEGWIPIRSEMEVGRKAPHNNVASVL